MTEDATPNAGAVEYVLTKMDLQDGDVLVVQFISNPTLQKANAVHASFKALVKKMGLNIEIAMIDNTMALSVLRPQKETVVDGMTLPILKQRPN